MDEQKALEDEIRELKRGREELLSDNRRMAEMLATSEGDNREVADMLERLSNERKQLQRQCHRLRESGRWRGFVIRSCSTCVGNNTDDEQQERMYRWITRGVSNYVMSLPEGK